MKFYSTALLGFLSVALATTGVQAGPIVERQGPVAAGGHISAPAVGDSIPVDSQFDFRYTIPTYCRPPGTFFSVWLTEHAPTSADVDDNAQLKDYLFKFGTYANPNYPGGGGIPPPPEYTMPPVKNTTGPIYFAVVADQRVCGAEAPSPFDVTSNKIIFVAS